MGVNMAHSKVFENGSALTVAGHVDVGAEPSRIKLGIKQTTVYKFSDERVVKAILRIGLMGNDIELGIGKKLSDYNSGYFAVVWGLAGVFMKLKVTRGGQSFEFPFILSHNYDEWRMLIAAYTVPPVFSFLLARYVILPLQKLYKKFYQPKLTDKEKEQFDIAQDESLQAMLVLKPAVHRKIREELQQNGIIVIEAVYGCLDDYFSGTLNGVNHRPQENGGGDVPNSSILNSLRKEWLDVTIAVQFLVNNGMLELHSGSSKQFLIGFSDPCPSNKNKQLHIRWFQHGEMAQQLTIEDKAGCVIPGDGVEIQDSNIFDKMMTKFEQLRQELSWE
eukprot:TRINITY_DN7527_c1_g1_i2.p1 TRINITY_DN7527_c1_g1~~TRINITY_DN7527_c1_g1_i2.p1  ORF type:complete len:333 (-),score=39.31 TRINITY_DN7527_c1_g1_i2:125-1123(-)